MRPEHQSEDHAAAESASARNRRVTAILEEAGRSAHLRVEREYPLPGGRVDVVWIWDGPEDFPVRLPLVAFEVESSWRSRKHIKGDFLNLIDLQPALGVIVLLGDDTDVESTRVFARDLVERHSARIEVWSDSDVERLKEGRLSEVIASATPLAPEVEDEAQARSEGTHRGKYARLATWLARQSRSPVDLDFGAIEEILGFPLPPSRRNHVPHWHSYKGSAVARAIIDAGWRARNVNLNAERVILERRQ